MNDTPDGLSVRSLVDVAADPAFRDDNDHAERFAARLTLLGKALGTSQIGLTVTEVPPGRAAWPRHFHHVNEEVFWILEGEGRLRYGDTDRALAPNDWVRIAPGTGIAFQIRNEGTVPLRYLALSGLSPTDVFEYPDSGKIGVVTGGGGPMRGPHGRLFFTKLDHQTPYWDGE